MDVSTGLMIAGAIPAIALLILIVYLTRRVWGSIFRALGMIPRKVWALVAIMVVATGFALLVTSYDVGLPVWMETVALWLGETAQNLAILNNPQWYLGAPLIGILALILLRKRGLRRVIFTLLILGTLFYLFPGAHRDFREDGRRAYEWVAWSVEDFVDLFESVERDPYFVGFTPIKIRPGRSEMFQIARDSEMMSGSGATAGCTITEVVMGQFKNGKVNTIPLSVQKYCYPGYKPDPRLEQRRLPPLLAKEADEKTVRFTAYGEEPSKIRYKFGRATR